MICSSFQFEVIYNPMLNFQQVYREVMAPFTRLADSVDILEENRLGDTVYFNFYKEGFDILCNFQSIAFRTQEDLTRFTKSANSPVRIFYDMLAKLKSIESFGNVRGYNVSAEYLNPISTSNVIEPFSKKFLSEEIYKNFSNEKYIGLSFTVQEEKRRQDIYISTYNRDFTSEQLQNSFPIDKSVANKYLANQQGYHVFYKLYESAPRDISFNLLKELVDESIQTNNKYIGNDN